MILDACYVIASLVLLYFGADLLVRGAGGLAVRLGVPPLVVGLTIVAYGTSAPELLVSLQGALDGRGGIAAGNVVGSSLFNVYVILGIAALVQPVHAHKRVLRFDVPLLCVVTGVGIAILWDHHVTRLDGIVLLAGAAGYSVASYIAGRKGKGKDPGAAGDDPPEPRPLWRALLELVGGLALLVGGSHLLVMGAVGLAAGWGVSEAVIGLTVVAAGTSMPELATSVVAARKGHADIALGNIVGSNLFNFLLILGGTATVTPFEAHGLTRMDLYFLGGTSVLLLPMVWTGARVGRREGGLLLAAYACYLYVMWP